MVFLHVLIFFPVQQLKWKEAKTPHCSFQHLCLQVEICKKKNYFYLGGIHYAIVIIIITSYMGTIIALFSISIISHTNLCSQLSWVCIIIPTSQMRQLRHGNTKNEMQAPFKYACSGTSVLSQCSSTTGCQGQLDSLTTNRISFISPIPTLIFFFSFTGSRIFRR